MDRTWAGKTSRTCFPQVLFPSPLSVSQDAPYHGAPLKTKLGASWKTVVLGHHFQRACVPLLGYWDAPDELQTDPYKAFSHFYESLLGCSTDYNFSRMSEFCIHKLNLACYWSLSRTWTLSWDICLPHHTRLKYKALTLFAHMQSWNLRNFLKAFLYHQWSLELIKV